MWDTATSTVINWFSDPSNTVSFSPPLLCADGGTVVRPLGTTAQNNRAAIQTRRMLSSVRREPDFYVSSTAGDGVATYLSPENDVADVYNQWFGLTEADPAEKAPVFIEPGNYPQPLLLNRRSDLLRWGSSGSVVLGN
jgi:hypothetical protein